MLTHCLDGRRNGTSTSCLDVRGSQCQLATEPTSSTPARATLNIVTFINGWLRLSSRWRPLPTTIRQPVLTHCLDGRRDGMLAACLNVSRSQCQLVTEPTSSTLARATLNTVTFITGWLRLSSQRRPLPTTIHQPVPTANRRNIEFGVLRLVFSRSRFASLSSVASMLVGGRLLFPWTREFDVYMLVRSCVNEIVDAAIVGSQPQRLLATRAERAIVLLVKYLNVELC
jgi:hypothetical protein